MNYQKNDNNWIYDITVSNLRVSKKLLGIQCPHCGYFMNADDTNEEWSVDAFEHITYCSPSHKRAMSGERL